MGRAYARLFGVGVVLLAAVVSAGAQSRARKVISIGDSAPGGGTFQPSTDRIQTQGLPSIAGNTIVFGCDVELNGQTVYGVYTENNSVLRLIARVGSPAPNGGVIKEITHFVADQFGNVFLLARTGDGTTPDVVFKYSFPISTTMARIGDSLPDTHTISSFGVAIAPDGRGGVYFEAGTNAAPNSFDAAIVRAKGDALNSKEIVAATGMPAPSGGTFSTISPSTLTSSTSGLVAFTATVSGGSSGIFAGITGNLAFAADAPDALPNITIADNDDAEVSFTQPSSTGIKTVTLSGVTTFVANGTSAPRSTGTINFGQFQIAMSADREGSVYFFAPISGDNMRGAGLFKRDRFTNVVTSIALQNDPAGGDVSGVYGIFALASSHPARIANDDGKVVFTATAGSQSNNVGIFTTLGAPEGLVPTVSSVQVKGAKLVVVGSSFENGARILVNGTPLADTKNNKKTPSTKLTSKSGATTVHSGSTVSITVRNATGSVSAPVSFTRP